MKRAFVILACLLLSAGMGLRAQEVTITLKPGWTWIGFPFVEAKSISEALPGFVPMDGDEIVSKTQASMYDEEDEEWSGPLQTLVPGLGYMYHSTRTEAVQVMLNAQTSQVVVTTGEPTDITYYSAMCGGTVTVADGDHVFMRGVCWGTEPNPTVDDNRTTDEAGIGGWDVQVWGLTMGTTYHVRAYAVTDSGLKYGEDFSFTTENISGDDHAYVDLGLPSGTLWATCNIGANAPEEYGDYFAWGETQPKDVYDWSTYQYCNGSSNTLTKYCNDASYGNNGFTDTLTILLPEDDAATANWGADWRMPTKEEWQELYNNTTVTWTTQNGVNGRLFTASNGNSLFLPAAGYRYGSSLAGVGTGSCWSSTLYTVYPDCSWYLYFSSGECRMYLYYGRFTGQSVRPVRLGQSAQTPPPTGAINGQFSINANGDQVFFSQGNLQYIGSAATPYWKFADNQWDFLGYNGYNGQGSTNQNADRDLFGWGTSGYDHGAICYQPWSTSTNNSDYCAYGNYTYNLNSQTGQADWGFNPISNGGNQPNQWRTLTKDEWIYVFDTRTTASGIRFAKASVNNVKGVILLPDDWSPDYYSLNNTNIASTDFSSNAITASDWNTMELHGAVFLPAAGERYDTSVYNAVYNDGTFGNYWSSSYDDSDFACDVYFDDWSLDANFISSRRYGCSVRLIHSVQ